MPVPLHIRDRIVLPPYLPPYFKVELLAAIFAAISYGIVVVLSGNCFHLLLKKRDIYPNRMRILLPIYVIVMLLSSTWKQFGSISTLMGNLTSKHVNLSLHRSTGLPTIVTTWGADGFIVRIPIIFHYQKYTMHYAIADMALSHPVSGRLQKPQGWNNCRPFTYFIRFF